MDCAELRGPGQRPRPQEPDRAPLRGLRARRLTVVLDPVAEDVHRIVTAKNPLSGEYRRKRGFLEATYEPLAAVLKQPIRPRERRIIAEGDLAVVHWRGHAASIAGPTTTTFAGSSD
jgi:ketosteroid isomerase-like protein